MDSEKDRERLRKIVTKAVLKKGNDMSRYETDRFIDNTPVAQHEKWLKEHVDKGNV
jgi:hypothetical protein